MSIHSCWGNPILLHDPEVVMEHFRASAGAGCPWRAARAIMMDPTSGARAGIDVTSDDIMIADSARPEADDVVDDPGGIFLGKPGEVVVDSREPMSTKDAAACHRR